MISCLNKATNGHMMLPRTPTNDSSRSIGNPQRSSRENLIASRIGNRLTAIRPPSSGGSGNRLSTMSTQLMTIPILLISVSGSVKSLAGINQAMVLSAFALLIKGFIAKVVLRGSMDNANTAGDAVPAETPSEAESQPEATADTPQEEGKP